MALIVDAIIALVPFIFSLLVLSMIRKTEIYCREPWAPVISAFIYGSSIAVFIAIVISETISIFLGILGMEPILFALASAAVVAPVVEESAKCSGIFSVSSRLTEVENGIIYGSAVGLGFSATENVIYFFSAYYAAGVEALIATVLLRFLTSTFLHLGASGLAGYGIGLASVQRKAGLKPINWAPFLFAAMGIHAIFNFLTYLPYLNEQFRTEISVIVLFLGVAMVWLLFAALRRRIKALDRTSGCAINGSPSTTATAPTA